MSVMEANTVMLLHTVAPKRNLNDSLFSGYTFKSDTTIVTIVLKLFPSEFMKSQKAVKTLG